MSSTASAPAPIRIAHLADIHIQDRRRDEYSNILAKLYTSLREEKPDIIAVVGDIFDSKTKATSHNFSDVGAFLEALVGIAPTVAICGNHDTNLSTPGALDLLTPVVAEHRGLQPPKLTYWRSTGVYAAHGVIWVVVAPDGPKPTAKEVEAARQKFEADGAVTPGAMQICLFHEEVDGAALPNGMLLRDSRLTPKDFAPYDAALGGHIHQRQMITPRAGYCSSLVQQNIGESHIEHGYMLWELTPDPSAPAPYRTATPAPRGVNIPNERGYLRIQLSGGLDVTQEPRPVRPYYYEVMHDESTPDDLVSAKVEELTEAMGFKPRAIRHKADQLAGTERAGKEPKLPDGLAKAQESARSVEVHETIIRDILRDSPVLEQVVKLHRERYAEIAPRGISRARIRLLRLDFDNLCCYGPGNSVDFTRIERCLSGVVARNHMGKSSLINIVVFALYDEVAQGGLKKSIINVSASSYRLMLLFELDGKIGCIEKSENATRSSALRHYRFKYADEDLTQGDVKSTCVEITRIVGTYEDAQLTTISHQGGGADFVLQTPAQRKKAVARLLALGSFEGLEKYARDTHYGCNAAHKALQEQAGKGSLTALEHKRDRAAGDAEDAAAAADEIRAEIARLQAEQKVNHARELEISARLATCSARRAGFEPSADHSALESVESIQQRVHSLLAAMGLGETAQVKEELATAEYRAHDAPAEDDDMPMPSAEETRESWRFIRTGTARVAQLRAEAESARIALAAMPVGKSMEQPRPPANPRPADATPWPESRKGARPRVDTIEVARAFLSAREAVEYDNLVVLARAPIGLEPPRTECDGEYDRLRSGAGEDALLCGKLHDTRAARGQAARRLEVLRAARPSYMAEHMPTVKTGKIPVPSVPSVAACESMFEKAKAQCAAVEAAQVLKDTISLQDGCQGCEAVKRILSSTGLDDYQRAAANAEAVLAESRYAVAYKIAMEMISVGDAVRRADGEILAITEAAERAQRLQSLEEERVAAAAYQERKAQQATWQQHLCAVNTLEAAAFWWEADGRAWAAYDTEQAVFEEHQAEGRQREALKARMLSTERQMRDADEAVSQASSTVARRVAALKQIVDSAAPLRRAQANKEREAKHRQAVAEENELKTIAQKAAKQRQEVEGQLNNLQVKCDQQQKRIISCRALEARASAEVAEESKRVEQVAEIQERRDTLEAYRRVLKTSGGIADRLLVQARGVLETAINQALEETAASFRITLNEEFELTVGAGAAQPAPSSERAGGYQKFVISLASRYALWRLAEVPLLDAQFVDEGFSVCDDDNLEAIGQWLEGAVALATAPRLHFAVTHLESLKNRLEWPLSIERRAGGSYVANGAPLERAASAAEKAALPALRGDAAAAKTKTPLPAAAAKTRPAPKAEARAPPLPPDPDSEGCVWCEVCGKSLQAARGAKHQETAVHAAAVKRAAKKAAAAAAE
jgi:DNA repair exonuclease SbcCD nuclease subunit